MTTSDTRLRSRLCEAQMLRFATQYPTDLFCASYPDNSVKLGAEVRPGGDNSRLSRDADFKLAMRIEEEVRALHEMKH